VPWYVVADPFSLRAQPYSLRKHVLSTAYGLYEYPYCQG
jgi:hypothetical protein